ncbi:MAG: hypothetical protein FJ276_03445 [Planctomycetes bacterium]|nr:hypothetical protein [Planctomycetota bacterium]
MVGTRRTPPGPMVDPTRRVVLLGASNVTLGLSAVVETACRVWGRPLDIMAAIGLGRSYGARTSVLGRGLPGIAFCGIWEALANRAALPTAALLTDVGNDILYGSDVDVILRWVATCGERLAAVADPLVITGLPLASGGEISRWKYGLFRSVLFPSSRLDLGTAMSRARDLDARLVELAGRWGALLVRPERSWYGWDPIHIARRHRVEAWSRFFGGGLEEHVRMRAASSLRRWLALRCARPLQWTRFGMERHRRQPSVRLSDGSRLSFF